MVVFRPLRARVVTYRTGRSLKVDPIGTGRPQSTSRGEGGRPGIYFKAGSATTEGPGPDPQSTFIPNLLSLGIYFQRPAGKSRCNRPLSRPRRPRQLFQHIRSGVDKLLAIPPTYSRRKVHVSLKIAVNRKKYGRAKIRRKST